MRRAGWRVAMRAATGANLVKEAIVLVILEVRGVDGEGLRW